MDQPFGISFLLICIYLAKIWSLISYRDLPTYGLYMIFSKLNTYPSEHALISHDASGEIINGDAMILPAHDLWSHVPGGTRSVLIIFRTPLSRNTEISDAQITFTNDILKTNLTIFIKDEVFRLDISVKDIFVVNIFEACD